MTPSYYHTLFDGESDAQVRSKQFQCAGPEPILGTDTAGPGAATFAIRLNGQLYSLNIFVEIPRDFYDFLRNP